MSHSYSYYSWYNWCNISWCNIPLIFVGFLAAGKILALWERDLPHELSVPDLKTVGRTDLGGVIDTPKQPHAHMAAHYRVFQVCMGGKGDGVGVCGDLSCPSSTRVSVGVVSKP